jgi:hypothetical protein
MTPEASCATLRTGAQASSWQRPRITPSPSNLCPGVTMPRLLLVAALATASLTFAAPKTYQVTGPVLELNGPTIVVMKGKDRWEINKGEAKVEGGELKVGSKVTITYTMTADSIEVKADKKK